MLSRYPDLPPGCTPQDIEDAFGGDDIDPDYQRIQDILNLEGFNVKSRDEVLEIVDEIINRPCSVCTNRRQTQAEAELDRELSEAAERNVSNE